jgi:hypothetical protein
MRIAEDNNTFISPIDKYGKISNQQIIVVAKTGYGKSLCLEGITEWYHNHGYTIIVISDPKHELEFCYQMFEPVEQYHLNLLKIARSIPSVGNSKNPGKQKVKIYHPFTFNLPINKNLPKMNIFTIPIKSLGLKEWAMLSEVHGENDTISVLLKSSEEISDSDGIYSFAHYVQDSVKGRKGKKKADWSNFGLETGSGTMKETSKISNILRHFKKHFFIQDNKCPYNLNWKDILTDQEHYHVFVSNFIGRDDEKLTDFLVLYLLEGILKNKKFIKDPILLVIPEVSKLTPARPEGHKEFLASSIKDSLKSIRSEGKGISSLLDGQIAMDIDDNVRDASSIQIYGELMGIRDIDGLCKSLGWGKKLKDQLNNMETPKTYLVKGIDYCKPDEGSYWFFPPIAMHKEENYNFEEMYLKHHRKSPEEYPLENYKKIYNEMKDKIKLEEMKIRAKVKKREQEQEKIEREKEESKETGKTEAVKEVKKEKKEIEEKNKLVLMKLCWERFNDETLDSKERSYRKIAEKLDIKSHKTVKKYIDNYKKILEEEQSKDFEEKFLDEVKE